MELEKNTSLTEPAELSEKNSFCLSGGTDKQKAFPPQVAKGLKAFGESAFPLRARGSLCRRPILQK
jgi:hypothetical protein